MTESNIMYISNSHTDLTIKYMEKKTLVLIKETTQKIILKYLANLRINMTEILVNQIMFTGRISATKTGGSGIMIQMQWHMRSDICFCYQIGITKTIKAPQDIRQIQDGRGRLWQNQGNVVM